MNAVVLLKDPGNESEFDFGPLSEDDSCEDQQPVDLGIEDDERAEDEEYDFKVRH